MTDVLVLSPRTEFIDAVRAVTGTASVRGVNAPAAVPRSLEDDPTDCLVVDGIEIGEGPLDEISPEPERPFVLIYPARNGLPAWAKDHDVFVLPSQEPLPAADALSAVVSQALRYAETAQECERYRLLAETAPDGLYILDENLVYRYVNESFAALLGFETEELIGEHLSKIHDQEGVEAAKLARKRAMQRDDPIETTYNDHITVAGDRIPCEVQFRAITDESGGLVGTVGVLRDITVRLDRERELERHNERLRRFSQIVSHDIRSPLTVAQGNAELAAEADEPDSYLEKVIEALDRLDAIVSDLLTLAKEGREISERTLIDLQQVAREATLVVDTTDANVIIDVDGVNLMGDENRLRRLFENLFRNAVDHGGPRVSIRVGKIEGGFFIEDDGPGIPEEERDRVFESGYTTTENGTGYGLNIVQEIAAAHGMTVRVTEGSDGGARFEVTEEAPSTEQLLDDLSDPGE